MQRIVHEKIHRTVTGIAQSAGASAEVTITRGYPVTYNDEVLTAKMLPTLQAVAGEKNTLLMKPVMGAEDFSFFGQKTPALYFFLGGRPKNVKREESAAHHTPDFYIDESGLKLGVRTMCNLVIDYMAMEKK
jgi:metal-dependent amidase/aminoacylase/carboxypeptidase family protein